MNTAAPIVKPEHGAPAWIAPTKDAIRRSIAAFRRAVGLSALGAASSDDWTAWRDAMADAFRLALAGGVAATVAEVDRSMHEIPRVTVGSVEPGSFDAAIDRLRAAVVLAGESWDRLGVLADEYANAVLHAESRGGAAELVARFRAIVERQERAFSVRGATAVVAGRVRETVIEYMLDAGRSEDKRKFDAYSSVIARVEQQLGVADNRADTIIRTNTLRAYNGIHADRLALPEVRRVLPLVVLVEIHDSRTRGAPGGIYRGSAPDNPGWHWEMDGLVGTIEQFRAWNVIPPNGYRCRGSIRGLTLAECEELGFLDVETMAIDMKAVRRHNGGRLKILASGLYPDRGFKRGAAAAAA